MSLARRHRERILAAQTVSAAAAPVGGAAHVPAAAPLPAAGATNAPVSLSPSVAANAAAAQVGLRLTHDLRRLKEIRSIDLKIAAKRTMIPEYRAWIEGILAADNGVGTGIAADALPTMMVWAIDTGDYEYALTLAEFVLRHRVALPKRYERDAATLIVEEIADQAIRAQNGDGRFSFEILERVQDLTFADDIHDQVRAKLLKAIGVELVAAAQDMEADPARAELTSALSALREAQRLHDRIGVKDKIKRADKMLAAINAAAPPPATDNAEQGGAPAA